MQTNLNLCVFFHSSLKSTNEIHTGDWPCKHHKTAKHLAENFNRKHLHTDTGVFFINYLDRINRKDLFCPFCWFIS